MTVTVCIPSIPERAEMLERALASVASQTRQPDAIAVAVDHDRQGAMTTRNRALAMASTEWVAFLDDDDELDPDHLEQLLGASDDADVVYPGCRIVDADGNELPQVSLRFGEPFDADLLRRTNYIPVTSMVRTRLAQGVGGFSYPRKSKFEDWGLYLKLLDIDARFHHHAMRTWTWHKHGANTGGGMPR